MGRKEIGDLLKRTSDIEKELKPLGSGYMPDVKTINRSPAFQTWKEELKQEIHMMEQTPLTEGILKLLDTGFKNGIRDKRDFIELEGKLNVLSAHLDDYFGEQTGNEIGYKKMKKGTVVKTAFDEYTLIEQVGAGGNGRVFSAKTGSGDPVAIKFVERDIPAGKLKRFKNEINFCEHHKHKNIVEILDRGYVSFENGEYVFYVMPLYAETLRDKMRATIRPEDAISIFVGLLEGLSYAHKHGTIHRDIKPENIMFKNDSLEPIICDFGIAYFAKEELLTVVETKKNDRMANFQYAAPEQRIKGGEATAQTDIYALALILNEMFTGEIPQALDHKTIAECAPDFKFVDDVFSQLFRQKAEDRLYPEEKILTELKVREEQYKREQKIRNLQMAVAEMITPDKFEAFVLLKKYQDGNIIFTLNRDIPQEWFQIIQEGSFTHKAVIGYETYNLRMEKKNELSMPLYGNENTQAIEDIVSNVCEWISIVNEIYSDFLKTKAQEEQQRKEEERKAAIDKLEREKEISEIIANL